MPSMEQCTFDKTKHGIRCSWNDHWAIGSSKKDAFQDLVSNIKRYSWRYRFLTFLTTIRKMIWR